MRRALFLVIVALTALTTVPRAEAALVKITIVGGKPDKDPASVPTGEDVYWQNDDPEDHTILFDGRAPLTAPSHAHTDSITVDFSFDYRIDSAANGTFRVEASEPPATTASSTTTTTTKQTTTTSTTTTSTSSTTTTSTSSTTTTTTVSSSGQIAIGQTGGGGGGTSWAPLLAGALAIVAALAGGAYWLWWRSGQAYGDEGPDWTQEPPPTQQGPLI